MNPLSIFFSRAKQLCARSKFSGISIEAAPEIATADAPLAPIEYAQKLREKLREEMSITLVSGEKLDLSRLILGEATESGGKISIFTPLSNCLTHKPYDEFDVQFKGALFSYGRYMKGSVKDAHDVGRLARLLFSHIHGDVSRMRNGGTTYMHHNRIWPLLQHHKLISAHMRELDTSYETRTDPRRDLPQVALVA